MNNNEKQGFLDRPITWPVAMGLGLAVTLFCYAVGVVAGAIVGWFLYVGFMVAMGWVITQEMAKGRRLDAQIAATNAKIAANKAAREQQDREAQP